VRNHVSGARALACLLLNLCFIQPLIAQQPTATTPTPPTARPGQTQQPSANRPQPAPTPSTLTTTQGSSGTIIQRKPGLPAPYYDYPFGSTTTRERSLTIDEAIRLALAQTSGYQQSQFDERIAREDVRQSRAAFLPQFTMPLTYFGTTPSRVRAEGDPLTFSYVSSSAINETIALVQAQGEVDISGRLRAALRRSRYLLEATRAGVLVARRELVIATVEAYYGLALARQKRRLADETLSLAEGFVKVAEGLAERGEGEESDVLRARAEALKRRDELEQARAGEAATMDLLRSFTGIDFETFIAVTRITEDVPTVADFSSYTEEIIRNRPEFALLDAQKRAALEDVTAARRERLPQLSYTLNGGFSTRRKIRGRRGHRDIERAHL
jgi:outer membrane protein TolC